MACPCSNSPRPSVPALLPLSVAAVREEAYRSLDPLRRLPELIRDAQPIMPDVLAPVREERGLVSGELLRFIRCLFVWRMFAVLLGW